MSRPPRASLPRLEVPTVALAVTVYAGWLALVLAAGSLPLPVWSLGVAIVLTLHGSLQHECIHGHPSANAWLNRLVAGPPLSLYLPYAEYRRSHLAHHRAARLTSPDEDPESFLVDASTFSGWSALRRAFAVAHMTLIGRLVLGPLVVVAQSARTVVEVVAKGDRDRRATWAWHGSSGVALLAFVDAAGVSVVDYLVFGVYPGIALTLLRSFAEHTPSVDVGRRTALLESRALGWLFLFNNLHGVHHERPGLPWYAIPSSYRRERDRWVARHGPPRRGYRSLLRYLVVPIASPVAPSWCAAPASSSARPK